MHPCIIFSAAIALAALVSISPALTIEGPVPDRVYQRTAANTADIDVAIGEAPAGATEVIVTLEGDGFSLTERAALAEGSASVTLAGIPAGGPYRIDVGTVSRSGDRHHGRTIGDILVGDLWVLAGQSNMEGTARLRDLEEPSPMVRNYTVADRWEVARDPMNRAWESVDPVHWRTSVHAAGLDDRVRGLLEEAGFPLSDLSPRKRPIPEEVRTLLAENGVGIADVIEAFRPDPALQRELEHSRINGAGLGVAFGKELHELTGVPVGFIFCAHGGTSIGEWSPALEAHGGESLYGSMVRRIRQQGGRIAGVAWYQGENDATAADLVAAYKDDFRGFIEAIRADVGDPELPFVYVQLGKLFYNASITTQFWNGIQYAQYALEDELPALAMVPGIEGDLSDTIHLDGKSLRVLGRQMARQAARIMGLLEVGRGPRLDGVELASEDRMQLRLRFRGVNGSLSFNSVYPQFRILDGSNRIQRVTRVEVDPEDPTALLLTLLYPAPSRIRMDYGRGINPLTGVVDSEGLALPVFPLMTFDLGSAWAP